MKHGFSWTAVLLVTLGIALVSAQNRNNANRNNANRNGDGSPAPRRSFPIRDAILEFTIDVSTRRLGTGNTVFSPFSIVTMLNMLLLGSTDNTYEQLRVVLKYPFEVEDLLIHQRSAIQLLSLQRSDRGINVQIANRIFTDSRFNITEQFMRDARDFYQAGVEQLEFGRRPGLAQRRINAWVRDQTKGKIQNLLSSPPARNTRMLAANVVYFNSSWESPFDPRDTKPLRFFTSEGNSIQTSMMFQQLEAPYASYADSGFKALAIPYQGGHYAMYIILPDEAGEAELARVESLLGNGGFERVVSDLRPMNISLWLPRFRMEFSVALRDVLQDMGATDIFQESRARLGRLSPDRNLFLSEVLHQAVIDVHEAGTEAAAVTVTLVNRNRLAKEFRVNRPFLFVIRDNRNGIPLFWGRMVQPESV